MHSFSTQLQMFSELNMLAARSPSLSASPAFDVDAVEIWRVEPPLPEDEISDAPRGGRSVLDKTKEDQEFMGLAGRQMHSSAERG